MHQPATANRPAGPARTWEASYPGTADQVRRVRADLHPLLADCPLADDVIAVVSELAANAVTHSDSRRPGGTFTVRLGYRPGEHVRAEVADQGSTWHGDLARSARDQHGLHIVLALATACGTSRGQLAVAVHLAAIDLDRNSPTSGIGSDAHMLLLTSYRALHDFAAELVSGR